MPKSFPLTIGKIPNNRRIIIREGNGKDIIDGIPLLFEGEISLKTTSSFGSIWDAESNNLMSLLSSSVEIGGKSLPSGQFAIQGAQIWQKSEPMEFSLSTKLEMIDSGKEDVVIPALTLMQTCLPTKNNIIEANNVFGLNLALQTLIPPGPNLQAIISSSGAISGGSLEQNINQKSRGLYTIEIPPNFIFNNMIIKEVNVDFSKTVDEFGFPVSASIDIEIVSMDIATTDMIVQIIKNLDNVSI